MGMIWIVGAIVWAAAEASFFFIVPDVLLTFIALRFGVRDGLKSAVWAAFTAALVGGILWCWGFQNIAGAEAVMLTVPAVDADLLGRARNAIAGAWPLELVVGSVTGVPYKLYAIETGAAQISLLLFLIMSFLARLLRFSGGILIVAVGRALATRLGNPVLVYIGWVIAWILIYAVYFARQGF